MLDMKKWPAYAPAGHWIYRLEYALLSLGILAALYFRATVFKDLDLALTFLFLVLPDAPFLAILPAIKEGHWPKWGAAAYNFTHSYLTWAALMLAAFIYTGALYWPVWAWALHISIDRAIGFNLRNSRSG